MNKVNLSIILLLACVSASCGGGSSDNANINASDNNIEDGTTSETDVTTTLAQVDGILTTATPAINLGNEIEYSISETDASNSPAVKISKIKNTKISEKMDETAPEFGVLYKSDFEIEINSSTINADDAYITVNPPQNLIDQVAENSAMVVYAFISEAEEQDASFIPLETAFDEEALQLRAKISSDYFVQNEKDFSIIMKLAVAEAENNTVTALSNRHTAKSGAPKSEDDDPEFGDGIPESDNPYQLLCPLYNNDNKCIETSRFGPRIGPNGDFHFAVDLRAKTGDSVTAAKSGVVERIVPDWGKVVVRSESPNIRVVYTHLSRIDCKVKQSLSLGDVVGLAGSTHTKSEHLHMEMYVGGNSFGQKAIKCKNASNPKCVSYVSTKVDPFKFMIYAMELELDADNEFKFIFPDGPFPQEAGLLSFVGTDEWGNDIDSQIDNNDGDTTKGQIRSLIWENSNESVLQITPQEILDKTSNPVLATNIKDRNRAKFTLLSKGNATVSVRWDGIDKDKAMEFSMP